MSDPPIYIMLGHGAENPVDFDKREIFPTGPLGPWSTQPFMLVTSTECGSTTTSNQLSHLIEVLKANKELAKDPYTNRDELGRLLGFEIRVYKPGDRYPSLLFAPKSFHRNDSVYDLSGVVNLNALRESDIEFIKHPESVAEKSEKEIIAKSWEKSLYPKKEDIKSLNDRILEATPVEFVFSALGPGIYYFPVCRFFEPKNFPAVNPRLIQHRSTQQQQTRRGGRRKRMKKRLTKRRKYGTRRTAMRLV